VNTKALTNIDAARQAKASAIACKGVYGARLMGGGFGGSALAIVEPAACEEVKAEVAKEYEKKFGIECQVHVAEPADGTAIIDL